MTSEAPMKWTYLFSSNKGDIFPDAASLGQPLYLSSTERHPFLTIKHYFDAVRLFLFSDNATPIFTVLSKMSNQAFCLDQIDELVIRSEKQGSFYLVASVTVISTEYTAKFTASSAFSDAGRKCLQRDFDILARLDGLYNTPYLPKAYLLGNTIVTVEKQNCLFSHCLSEWFDDFHEWHVTGHGKTADQHICIWDYRRGNRLLSIIQTDKLCRQVAKILTLYFNPTTFEHIAAWHHAAGDFIIRADDENLEVRLTTVRDYTPLFIAATDEEPLPLMLGIIHFILRTTLQMRLDKIDGVGESSWLEIINLSACLAGFFDGFLELAAPDRYQLTDIHDLLELLKSFTASELKILFGPVLGQLQLENFADFPLILAHLEEHITALHAAIKKYQL